MAEFVNGWGLTVLMCVVITLVFIGAGLHLRAELRWVRAITDHLGLDLVDEYRGPKLGAGARGLTIRLVFRAGDRTLRDAEVDAAVQQVITSVQQELGVQLRAS